MARLNRNSTFKYVAFVSSVDSTPSASNSDATLYSLSLACNCCIKKIQNKNTINEIPFFKFKFEYCESNKILRLIGREVGNANRHYVVRFVKPS